MELFVGESNVLQYYYESQFLEHHGRYYKKVLSAVNENFGKNEMEKLLRNNFHHFKRFLKSVF